MSDIRDFLLARVEEDEAAARAARDAVTEHGVRAGSPWIANGSLLMAAQVDGTHGEIASTADYRLDAALEHIARHDPARVLAECKAKRSLINGLAEEEDAGSGLIAELEFANNLRRSLVALSVYLHLAAPYADHPEYRPEWRLYM